MFIPYWLAFRAATKKLCGLGWTPIRYVTLHLRDQREPASLRHRNRAEITVSSYVWTKALYGMAFVPAQKPRWGGGGGGGTPHIKGVGMLVGKFELNP